MAEPIKKYTPTQEVCTDRFTHIETSLTNLKKQLTSLRTFLRDVKQVLMLNQKQLEDQGPKISEIEKKVFNGFGSDIENLKGSMLQIEKRNDDHHSVIRKEIHSVRNLVFTLLITIVTGVVINVVVQERLSNRNAQLEESIQIDDTRVVE